MGTNTGINYRNDFEEYLELLLKGIQRRKRSVLNVFKEWDRVLFPNSDSSAIGEPGSGHKISSGMKTALDMLDGDEDEDNGVVDEDN